MAVGESSVMGGAAILDIKVAISVVDGMVRRVAASWYHGRYLHFSRPGIVVLGSCYERVNDRLPPR